MDRELFAALRQGLIALTGCPAASPPDPVARTLRRRVEAGRPSFRTSSATTTCSSKSCGTTDSMPPTATRRRKGRCGSRRKIGIAAGRDQRLALTSTARTHTIHDVLLCVGTNTTRQRSQASLKLKARSYYVQAPAQEMRWRSAERAPEACEQLAVGRRAGRSRAGVRRMHLPELRRCRRARRPTSDLDAPCLGGLNRRWGTDRSDAVRRAAGQYELDVVESMGFAHVLPVVWCT